MTLSTSQLAYRDCYDVLDAALADHVGVRIEFKRESPEKALDHAMYFNMRLNQARKLERKKNALTYSEDHALHGSSQYDSLRITIEPRSITQVKNNRVWIMVKHVTVGMGRVESLSSGSTVEMPDARELPVFETETETATISATSHDPAPDDFDIPDEVVTPTQPRRF